MSGMSSRTRLLRVESNAFNSSMDVAANGLSSKIQVRSGKTEPIKGTISKGGRGSLGGVLRKGVMTSRRKITGGSRHLIGGGKEKYRTREKGTEEEIVVDRRRLKRGELRNKSWQ